MTKKGNSNERKSLCKEGKEAAEKKYKKHSAYASGFAKLVCMGKRRGLDGKMKVRKGYEEYKNEKDKKKKESTSGLSGWFKEKWVDVCSKKKDGSYKPCGRKNADDPKERKQYPYCRPSVRVNKNTPKTVGEMKKSEIEKMCKKKAKAKGKKNVYQSSKVTEYPFLPLKTVEQFEDYAEYRKVSKVARGEKKSSQSDMGFLEAYKKVKGNKEKLKNFPIKKEKKDGQDWWERRNNFCARHNKQMKNEDKYEKEGKYKGLPTRRHLGLIMWAYSPDSEKIKELGNKMKKIMQEKQMKN